VTDVSTESAAAGDASAPACEPARRGRPRSPEADEAIITAALEVLVEGGMGRLSMDEVAARAAVSKATIYRRWSSKEAMILDALTAVMTKLDTFDTGSLPGDLGLYVAHVADKMRNGRTRDLLPHLLAAAINDPNLQPALDEFLAIRDRPLRAMLERAIDRGELAPDTDVALVADMLLGALTHQRLFHGTTYDHERVTRLVEYVLRVLAV